MRPSWKKAYAGLDGYINGMAGDTNGGIKSGGHSDPTSKCAEKRAFYSNRIKMVEKAAMETDDFFGPYILKAVTQGVSYDNLKTRWDMPCSKDKYYEFYRKFFWILSNSRE